MNKKIISIILVISILSISVLAAAPNVTDGADVNSSMSDYPSYPSNNVVTSTFPYAAPVQSIPYPTPGSLSELWANIKNGIEALLNLNFIGSYLLNIKTYLMIDSSNGNTIGNRVNDINSNIYYAYNGPLKGVFNMLSSTNGASGGWYYRTFKALYDPNNPADGLISGIYTRLATIINQTNLTQSDIHGIYTMFASGQVGGSAYYNQLIASGGALENIETSSANTVAGLNTVDNSITSLISRFTNNGQSVFYNSSGHNYLNNIDASTSDLLNYFYSFFIDDDRPNSTNGGEAIVGLYNNSNSLVSGYGYNSNSTLANAISNISSKEDTQITELRNIIDVLANQNDTTIINNQTNNTTTVSQQFFNGSSTDTSLGTQDFIDIGNILSDLRNLLDPNINLSGFGVALQNGINAGQSFFSQEVYNDLNGVTG